MNGNGRIESRRANFLINVGDASLPAI